MLWLSVCCGVGIQRCTADSFPVVRGITHSRGMVWPCCFAGAVWLSSGDSVVPQSSSPVPVVGGGLVQRERL